MQKGRLLNPPDPIAPGDRLRHESAAIFRAKAGECSTFDDLAREGNEGTVHCSFSRRHGKWQLAKVWVEITSLITEDDLAAPESMN